MLSQLFLCVIYLLFYFLVLGQDRSFRMTSTVRDAQSCELSQGIVSVIRFFVCIIEGL